MGYYLSITIIFIVFLYPILFTAFNIGFRNGFLFTSSDLMYLGVGGGGVLLFAVGGPSGVIIVSSFLRQRIPIYVTNSTLELFLILL